MKHLISKTLLALALAVAISCTPQKEKEVTAINKLEKEFMAEGARPEQAKLDELMQMYEAFISSHPKDSLAPRYLYKAISLSMGTGDGQKAIELTDRMMNEYPDNQRIPEVLFLKAFIYENQLGNLGQALKNYQAFLKRFPEHELANDAHAAIDNLGKSPEELVKEFEAKAEAEAEAAK